MSRWTPVYTDDQRAAVERAYCDLRIRPLREIQRLAKAGELDALPGGERLPGFDVTYSSVRDIGTKGDRRKAGLQLPAALAKIPPRDRAEAMQRRLGAIIDRELTRLERAQVKHPTHQLDAEHARKMGRALRELSTLPDPHDMRLPQTADARESKADTLASQLMAASDKNAPSDRINTRSAQNGPTQPAGAGETDTSAGVTTSDDTNDHDDTRSDHDNAHHEHTDGAHDAPGLRERGHSMGLQADAVLTASVRE
jgi:hypothetical protein